MTCSSVPLPLPPKFNPPLLQELEGVTGCQAAYQPQGSSNFPSFVARPVWSCLRLRLCACAVIVCLYACVYCGKGAGKQWRVRALWSQHSVASRPRACRKSVCDSLDDHDSTQIAGRETDKTLARMRAHTHTQLTHNSHTTHTRLTHTDTARKEMGQQSWERHGNCSNDDKLKRDCAREWLLDAIR